MLFDFRSRDIGTSRARRGWISSRSSVITVWNIGAVMTREWRTPGSFYWSGWVSPTDMSPTVSSCSLPRESTKEFQSTKEETNLRPFSARPAVRIGSKFQKCSWEKWEMILNLFLNIKLMHISYISYYFLIFFIVKNKDKLYIFSVQKVVVWRCFILTCFLLLWLSKWNPYLLVSLLCCFVPALCLRQVQK